MSALDVNDDDRAPTGIFAEILCIHSHFRQYAESCCKANNRIVIIMLSTVVSINTDVLRKCGLCINTYIMTYRIRFWRTVFIAWFWPVRILVTLKVRILGISNGKPPLAWVALRCDDCCELGSQKRFYCHQGDHHFHSYCHSRVYIDCWLPEAPRNLRETLE